MSIKDITIVITSFKSNEIIRNCLNSIDERCKIILVENSNDLQFKKKIEQEGHELITVPLRHRWFFDQGLHCITCDILREK